MALLLLGAFARDIEGAKDAAAERHRHVGAVAADLLGHDGEVDDAAAGAAIFLGKRQREEPGRYPGIVKLVGIEPLAIEPAQIIGRSDPLHQLVDAVPQELLLGRVLEIHDLGVPNPSLPLDSDQ